MANQISLITSVHNEEQYLEEALSLLKPYVNDVVVIDQGSTDSTVEIARKFTEKIYLFPRVYYSYAYIHEAALMASNEWILRCDPDERWDKELLDRLSEIINKDIDIYNFHMLYGGDDLSVCPRLWKKNRVIWTDTLDARPYNAAKLKIETVEGGRIENLRSRETSSERYRKEGAKRLLIRYGETKVPPYDDFCKYYNEIISGEKN